MLQIAILAERLTRGRGKELAIQERMIWNEETAPMGIKNMAKKRGPVDVVAVAMTLPRQASSIRQMMCRERSPVRLEVKVTTSETRKVPNQTGTVRRRVSILP